MKVRFVVEGKSVGYYTQGARPNWTRMRAYQDYKKRVQWSAKAAGLKLPLKATEEDPVYVSTRMFCSTRVHADPCNVSHGIIDALFYSGPGGKGDKHVGGKFEPATYGTEDCVWVEVAR